MTDEYDYIIIGAGSAGCVLANRLSADPANQVLLIEAGGENRNFMVTMPKGMGKLVINPQHAWQYRVDQDRAVGLNVNESWVRGRGLGGSSAINGLLYVRGRPQDYDHWEQEAGSEWGWARMKEAFRSIEDHELGDDGVRGTGGPLPVTSNKFRYPLAERIIEAGVQMGLPRHYEDLNREEQEGVGYYCYNIKDGKRVSAAVAFLDPVRNRPNLRVVTNVQVDRIEFDGRRATAVVCRRENQPIRYRARQEIILSAGAVNSPKLLQLSGIGPASLLKKHGIDVLVDSPNVGRGLLDHVGLMFTYRLKGDRGINHRLHGLGLAASVIQYLVRKSGPLSNGAMEVGAFFRTSRDRKLPNAQFWASGLTLDIPKDSNEAAPMQKVEHLAGMTIGCQLINTSSEGVLEISSAEPDAPLSIAPNWLSTEDDRRAVVELVHIVRAYVRQPSLAPYIAEEMMPGPQYQTDSEILDMAVRSATCGTHAVRSCRMGRDKLSVVDEQLRVRGVYGLRVVDCSIMPGLISGNTNASAMATGWRASDLILEDARLKNAA